jgi:hypothetical protein
MRWCSATNVFTVICLLLAAVVVLLVVLTATPANAQAPGASYTVANPPNNDSMGLDGAGRDVADLAGRRL